MLREKHAVLAAGLAALMVAGGSAALAGQGYRGSGQDMGAGTHLGFGYVVNAPEQLVGFEVMAVGSPWAGWGAFADAKFTHSSPSGEDIFMSGRTAAEALEMGDTPFGQPDEAWTTVNVGVVRAVGPEVALYAGGGYSQQTVYQEFQRQGEIGADRFYIVEDVEASGDRVNLLGGFYFRAMRNLMFRLGAETAPAGFTAGVDFVLPLGG